MSSKKYTDYWNRGIKTENAFYNWAVEKNWLFIREASLVEQKFGKWDQLWEVNKKQLKVEIKSRKRDNRYDDTFSSRVVVELMGVSKNRHEASTGWLYGEADLFAFQREDGFLLVEKYPLQSLINERVSNNCVVKNSGEVVPSWQVYHRRTQPLERCVYVPYEDMEALDVSQMSIL